jgi:F0F1-type ATP synthase membrane subunit b/b'
MQLYPNASILVQIAIFVVVWMGLRRLAFEPMQRALDERERRTVHAERAAEAMVAAAQADRAQYEQAVHERRSQMAQAAERARHAAIEESNRQIAAARTAIGRDLAAQRATVAAQVDVARRQLATEADAIAAQMLLGVTRGART